jgi:hypothetical protein
MQIIGSGDDQRVQTGLLDHRLVVGESVRKAILLSYLICALAVPAANGD